VLRADGVADTVEWREHIADEPTELLEQAVDRLGVGVRERRELRQPRQVDEVLEGEADVALRCDVGGHERNATGGPEQGNERAGARYGGAR
jgi:hypothetical protein